MARHSKISWTDDTFNPWIGCTRVSPACRLCYAERLMDHRYHRAEWGPGKPRVRTSIQNWNQVRKWNRTPFYEAVIAGKTVRGEQSDITRFHGELGAIHTELYETRRRVFTASLADIFDHEVDPAWRRDFFALVKECANIDFLVLTKRPELIGSQMVEATGIPMDEVRNGPEGWNFKKHLPNVLLGVTAETQQYLESRSRWLFRHPASLHWLSVEPQLGQLHFVFKPYEGVSIEWNVLTGTGWNDNATFGIGGHYGWVISGGESGEPSDLERLSILDPEWVRNVRDECATARVPFHFKQWGNRTHDHPNEYRAKTVTGHLLDGVEHFNFYDPIQ